MSPTVKFAATTALSTVLALGAVPAIAGSHSNNELESSVFSDKPAMNETVDSLQGDAAATDTVEAPASEPALEYKEAETDAADDMDAGDEGAERVAGSEYDEETLRAFVAAAVSVGDLRADYAAQVAEAADEAAAQALIVEAQTEMMKAVEAAEAITVEEYIEIGNAAQSNPELAEWLTAEIRKEVSGMAPEAGEADDG